MCCDPHSVCLRSCRRSFNTGHYFELDKNEPDTATKGFSQILNERYNFYQVHWHAPSENRVDGEQLAETFGQSIKPDELGHIAFVPPLKFGAELNASDRKYQ